MADQTKSAQSKRGSYVLMAWLTLVIGTLMYTVWLVMYCAAILGLTNAEPPPYLFPTSLGLVVWGYVACFTLPRLYKRVEELEQRVDTLTKGTTEQNKPGDQP